MSSGEPPPVSTCGQQAAAQVCKLLILRVSLMSEIFPVLPRRFPLNSRADPPGPQATPWSLSVCGLPHYRVGVFARISPQPASPSGRQ
jgi:hypothetical protein